MNSYDRAYDAGYQAGIEWASRNAADVDTMLAELAEGRDAELRHNDCNANDQTRWLYDQGASEAHARWCDDEAEAA